MKSRRYTEIRYCNFIYALLFCCAIICSSCFFTDSFMDQSTYPKWIMFGILTSLMLIWYGCEKHADKICYSNSDMLLGVVAVIILIIMTLNAYCFQDVAQWCVFCCFYVACRICKNYINIQKNAAIALVISAGICAVVAMTQLYVNQTLSGCYDNLVGLDITLILGILAIMDLLASRRYTPLPKLMLWLSLGMFIILALMTQSRVFILSIMICMVIYIPARKKLIITVALSVLCLFSFFYPKKTESSYGRLFILDTSLSLLNSPHRLITGYGENGFKKHYMVKQSERLKKESEAVKQRASNMSHPLNEFVMMAIKYGIFIPLIILVGFIRIMMKDTATAFQKSILAVIIIYMVFSYPLRYPITWIAIVLAMVVDNDIESVNKLKVFSKMLLSAVGLILLGMTFFSIDSQKYWKTTYIQAILGKRQEALYHYCELSKILKSDEFIYNYASYLHNLGMDVESKQIISDIKVIDYETSILSGQINMSLNCYEEALKDFLLAYDMCPNRFLPLFEIYRIYEHTDNQEGQIAYRNLIRNKQIKIKSPEVDFMINYVGEK